MIKITRAKRMVNSYRLQNHCPTANAETLLRMPTTTGDYLAARLLLPASRQAIHAYIVVAKRWGNSLLAIWFQPVVR